MIQEAEINERQIMVRNMNNKNKNKNKNRENKECNEKKDLINKNKCFKNNKEVLNKNILYNSNKNFFDNFLIDSLDYSNIKLRKSEEHKSSKLSTISLVYGLL